MATAKKTIVKPDASMGKPKMAFIADFKKSLAKKDSVSTTFADPLFWIDTGNYAMNKIVSGSFRGGIPQGRMIGVGGPSGSGKSFIIANCMANAQKDHGAFCILIDTEKAGNIWFYKNIGVDVSEDSFMYISASTHGDVIDVMSDFFAKYKEAYGLDNPEGPPVVVVLDSINGLITERDSDLFEKGDMKGAQGQDQKQGKQLMKLLRSKFSRINITFMFAMHVYANQDLTNGKGTHVLTEAYKYELSQVFMVTNKGLKTEELTYADAKAVSDKTQRFAGVSMKVTGVKTRFTQNNRSAEFDVPYKTGLSRLSNLLDMLLPLGVVSKSGAWWVYTDIETGVVSKFYEKDLSDELAEKMLRHPSVKADEENFQHGIEQHVEDEEQE